MQGPRTRIVSLLALDPPQPRVCAKGWIRTVRDSKQVVFLEINDGSCMASLQVVVPAEVVGFDEIRRYTTGSAVSVVGALLVSPAQGQRVELHAAVVAMIGRADPSFPLQKKRHGFEFLRTIAHLRARTHAFGAVFRVRSLLAHAIHEFFQQRGFVYIHTPIITANDCEGAGEMFRVSVLDPIAPPRTDTGGVDWSHDFFARQAYLTVSGQLDVEAFCMAFSEVYTFGPTFRAENSNTSRHAAEFWMIEPEIAFADLDDDADLAEAFVRHLLRAALDRGGADLALFDQRVERGLVARLEQVERAQFERMTYREAVHRLEASARAFEYPVSFGVNLQAEHERCLTETLVGRPVFVTDYPRSIKPFYMRQNDDGETVAAMDLLVPGVGELIGGSQREERVECLQAAMAHHGILEADYGWYLDTRRFGTAPHAGFGLGFERLLMYVTGMENIRDVIPFPRTPRHCEF